MNPNDGSSSIIYCLLSVNMNILCFLTLMHIVIVEPFKTKLFGKIHEVPVEATVFSLPSVYRSLLTKQHASWTDAHRARATAASFPGLSDTQFEDNLSHQVRAGKGCDQFHHNLVLALPFSKMLRRALML